MKKKLVLLCVLLLCGISTGWAQFVSNSEFEKKEDALSKQMSKNFDEKDYKKGEQSCKQLIELFNAQPEETQKSYDWLISGYYYNLACCQSILNKKSAAIKSLEQAYENGYQDYQHTLIDSDLDNIRSDKRFKAVLAKLKEVGDYLYILQQAPGYERNLRTDTLPKFTYANPNDSNLVRVRQYFKLDSVAGAGDEISKIKNILTFIHNKIRHDGQHGNPPNVNAIEMAEACKDGSRGLNCRGLATVLNECYLAMGFKSRFVTCMPKVYIRDCHVINAVYSNTLDKWLWIDPTNNAWVMDENGTLLSIQEVRERLRDGRPLVLNEEANWNNKSKQTKEEYLEGYMAKNLYCIECTDRSEFNTETDYKGRKSYPKYPFLCPAGFVPDYPGNMIKPDQIVYDDKWFWQSPYQE